MIPCTTVMFPRRTEPTAAIEYRMRHILSIADRKTSHTTLSLYSRKPVGIHRSHSHIDLSGSLSLSKIILKERIRPEPL